MANDAEQWRMRLSTAAAPAAAPAGIVEAEQAPVIYRQSPRRRRPVPGPARAGGGGCAWTKSRIQALDLTTGKVIGSLHAPRRAIEFKKFLATIDREVPAGLGVHVVLDDASTDKTPAIKRWLSTHPRFHLHFTRTRSSWLNLDLSHGQVVHRLNADVSVARAGVDRLLSSDEWRRRGRLRGPARGGRWTRQRFSPR